MKNFRLIDFSSIELPKGFIPSTDGKTNEFKHIIRNLCVLKGNYNFEIWLDHLFHVNHLFLNNELSIEDCIEIGKLLNLVGRDNEEIKEFIDLWKDEESEKPIYLKFMMNNIAISFFKGFDTSNYNEEEIENVSKEYNLRCFDVQDITDEDNVKITDIEDSKFLQNMWLNYAVDAISKHYLGFIKLKRDLKGFNDELCYYSSFGRNELKGLLIFMLVYQVQLDLEQEKLIRKNKIPNFFKVKVNPKYEKLCYPLQNGNKMKVTMDNINEIVEVNGEKVERPYFLNYEDD